MTWGTSPMNWFTHGGFKRAFFWALKGYRYPVPYLNNLVRERVFVFTQCSSY